MKRNILYIIGLSCLFASCVEEKFNDPQADPGKEVRFSVTVEEDLATKTIYGEESTVNGVTSVPVNWIEGDKISVYGETCYIKQAEYEVKTGGNVQNFASSLDKTGSAGVQWGDQATSDFYAVYPSTNASFKTTGEETVATTSISSTQNNVFELSNDTWVGKHFGDDASNPSMHEAIMYARTEGASPTDNNGNPTDVKLHFKPFTTVLKFRFVGYTSNLSNPTVYVQNITVTAPDGVAIAGKFDLDIEGSGSNASATAVASKTEGETSNTISVNTILPGGTYLPLKPNQAVEFNVFTIPQGYSMNGTDKLWTVTINTQGHGSFTYKMKPLNNATYNLVAGQIHKVKVPNLQINTKIEWDPENWITQIPTPVYISELSMPGTWYSCHSDYQNTTDLTLQYKAGIRAFNIDCRLTYSEYESGYLGGAGDLRLVCAGTDKAEGTSIRPQYTAGELVVDKLKTIASCIPGNEYVVVIITLAEKPLSRDPLLYDPVTYGNVDPAQIVPELVKILTGEAQGSDGKTVSTTDLKLYTSKITSNTTINDVAGHMIVKINTNNSGISNYTYPTNSLVSFASMAMSDWNSSGDNITDLDSDYYTKMQTAIMHWGNAETDLNYYYHQAQRTTSGVNEYDTNGTLTGTDYSTTYQVEGVPTIQMRKDAIKNIISQSKAIYDNGAHDGWFQLGIGGYIKDNDYADPNQSDVATALNSYVQNLIEDKMDTDPSPVGIVLMNHACDASGNGIQLVKDIIEMNGKFYLNRVGGSITTGDGTNNSGNGTTTTETKNAAYAVVGDNAF